jgi:thioredoxin reductase
MTERQKTEEIVIIGSGPAGCTVAGTSCMAALDSEQWLLENES